jgi:hypothetical protein
MQAIGAPNTFGCGDRGTAWASKERDARTEWPKLSYPRLTLANGALIVETFHPGAIRSIEAQDDSGNWREGPSTAGHGHRRSTPV